MSMLFSPMISDFWDHLNNDADYAALGLTEFRRMDGRIFEPQFAEEISDTDLPIHACDSIKVVPVLVTSPGTWDIETTLTGSLWFAADGPIGTEASSEIEDAMAKVFDSLHSPTTVLTGIGSNVREYEFIMDDITPIYADETQSILAYWTASYTLTLKKIR